MITTIIRLVAVGLAIMAGWNIYVVATGGAQRDIMNIGVIVTQGGLALLLLSKDIIGVVLSKLATIPTSTTPKPTAPTMPTGLTDDLAKLLTEYNNKQAPADAATPENPKSDNPRDIQSQQEILSAINKLYDYFQGDPSATALITNVAKAFATKCYPAEK